MATLDLGKIKQVWRGTYNNGTAYVVDDLVAYTDSNITSTYICVANSTGNAPSSSGTAHASWNYVAKGVVDPIPSQSGNAGKFLKTDGTNLSYDNAGGWVRIAGGQGPSSAATSVTIDNIFSDTYQFYKIFLKWTQDDHIRFRYIRASDGAEESGTNYDWKIISAAENSDESVADYGGNGNTRAMITYWNANDNGGHITEITFNNPYDTDNYSSCVSISSTTEGTQLRNSIMANTYRNNSSTGSHRGIILTGSAGTSGDNFTSSNFDYLVLGAKFA